MNRNEEFEQLIREYRDTPVPQSASDTVKDAIDRGCAQAAKRRRMMYIGGAFGTCAAAALVLLLIWLVPGKDGMIRGERQDNALNGSEKNPGDPMMFEDSAALGDADDRPVGAVEVADTGADPVAAGFSLGREADELMTEENCIVKALECFEEEMAQRQFVATLVDSEVLTNNDRWFTLAVCATESGNEDREIRGYYNIDKTSCEVVTLAQLYGGADNLSVIREEVSRQMKERQKADTGNQTENAQAQPVISENQSYYFNSTEELVIVLEADEAENVQSPTEDAAGYREFVIPTALLP